MVGMPILISFIIFGGEIPICPLNIIDGEL
jgi:hypothetical protein